MVIYMARAVGRFRGGGAASQRRDHSSDEKVPKSHREQETVGEQGSDFDPYRDERDHLMIPKVPLAKIRNVRGPSRSQTR